MSAAVKRYEWMTQKGCLNQMRFQNVRTIINSGNVLFETQEAARATLVKRIEQELTKTFGHDIAVILRTIGEIQDLFDSNPFKKVKVTPETRLHVTFPVRETEQQSKDSL